mmetsp:Transcript_54905/g.83102  ORF Transcript_54905/g.83102 Transcript_54905/m.83102 type:complete len:113 (+) Transcript_54905:343-681(+)
MFLLSVVELRLEIPLVTASKMDLYPSPEEYVQFQFSSFVTASSLPLTHLPAASRTRTLPLATLHGSLANLLVPLAFRHRTASASVVARPAVGKAEENADGDDDGGDVLPCWA